MAERGHFVDAPAPTPPTPPAAAAEAEATAYQVSQTPVTETHEGSVEGSMGNVPCPAVEDSYVDTDSETDDEGEDEESAECQPRHVQLISYGFVGPVNHRPSLSDLMYAELSMPAGTSADLYFGLNSITIETSTSRRPTTYYIPRPPPLSTCNQCCNNVPRERTD